ncbi:hypothetical protein TWF696_000380 [Orbilia brochopaga]|uniref:Uncharacterized protein n=1 Tax=Orbilia brochopaga TaxID=3140254 RepID=A0AAV9VDJ5_9PEZI
MADSIKKFRTLTGLLNYVENEVDKISIEILQVMKFQPKKSRGLLAMQRMNVLTRYLEKATENFLADKDIIMPRLVLITTMKMMSKFRRHWHRNLEMRKTRRLWRLYSGCDHDLVGIKNIVEGATAQRRTRASRISSNLTSDSTREKYETTIEEVCRRHELRMSRISRKVDGLRSRIYRRVRFLDQERRAYERLYTAKDNFFTARVEKGDPDYPKRWKLDASDIWTEHGLLERNEDYIDNLY